MKRTLLCVGLSVGLSGVPGSACLGQEAQFGESAEPLFDAAMFSRLMGRGVGTLDELAEDYLFRQSDWLHIAPPGPEPWLQPAEMLPFDPSGFPPEFVEGLVAQDSGGVTTCRVVALEDPVSRELVFMNAEGKELASIAPPKDYDPLWFALRKYPDLLDGKRSAEMVKLLTETYDPAKVMIRFSLITKEELVKFVWAKSLEPVPAALEEAAAVPEAAGMGFGMMSMGGSGTNTVSRPAGFVRLTIGTNSTYSETYLLASMPFEPFDTDINALFRDQLTGATSSAGNPDIITKWLNDCFSYTNAYKADGTGDSDKDGYWFSDLDTWTISELTFEPGGGYWIQNHQDETQVVFVCGEVLLGTTNGVDITNDQQLINYPFSAAINLNDSELGPDSGSSEDELSSWSSESQGYTRFGYWPESNMWYSFDTGQWVEETLRLGEGWFYSRVSDFSWTEPRPYANPFPANENPPRVIAMTAGANQDEMTLTIETTGDDGEKLEVYYQDLETNSVFNSTNGWLIAELNIETAGQTNEWTDAGSTNRSTVDEVYARYYLVGRGDIDTDGDGLPDCRESFIHHTDPNDWDSDDDGMPDGWEVRWGFDPNDPGDADDDPDNDGVDNLTEYLQGRRPKNGAVADTTGAVVNLTVYTPLE